MPRLAGKIAFITGAGNGIGRATAILFAREGAKVAIAEIDARAGQETAHLAGNEAIAIRADVTDPDSLQAAIRAIVDKFGRLDVLHNNAGGSTAQDDTAVNAPLDEFWRAIKLDLYGTFLGCRFGIPELFRRPDKSCLFKDRAQAPASSGRVFTKSTCGLGGSHGSRRRAFRRRSRRRRSRDLCGSVRARVRRGTARQPAPYPA